MTQKHPPPKKKNLLGVFHAKFHSSMSTIHLIRRKWNIQSVIHTSHRTPYMSSANSALFCSSWASSFINMSQSIGAIVLRTTAVSRRHCSDTTNYNATSTRILHCLLVDNNHSVIHNMSLPDSLMSNLLPPPSRMYNPGAYEHMRRHFVNNTPYSNRGQKISTTNHIGHDHKGHRILARQYRPQAMGHLIKRQHHR